MIMVDAGKEEVAKHVRKELTPCSEVASSHAMTEASTRAGVKSGKHIRFKLLAEKKIRSQEQWTG